MTVTVGANARDTGAVMATARTASVPEPSDLALSAGGLTAAGVVAAVGTTPPERFESNLTQPVPPATRASR